MKNSNKNIINILSFTALIIVALLMFVDKLLPVVGVTIHGGFLGTFLNALRTISNVFTLVILGVAAFKFTEGNKKWIKILFWIAVAIFIAATVLMWIR